ncbi:baseplate wedge subunit [Escherichia phage EcS1]|uniref:Baseplate wedge subunit and tail pin n=1 Tax=Escherichia phage EcS1 TaxID=2083276 RepID=A0A2Z5ZCM4_9CAUD|nr:baseplate wedge subunit [Escherichia phage EcS1]BBC78226.1 Baseplate wedge subunit and tail pin [Escherichia phage EcS1]
MIKSKIITKAGVYSRDADHIEFRQDLTKPAVVAGNNKFGDVTVSQLSSGFDFPTVQSAINDLQYRCEVPVNGVVMNTSGVIPTFLQQNDQWKITGEIKPTASSSTTGDAVMIYFLGFPVMVSVGDQPVKIASEIQKVLNEASINLKAISTAAIDATDTTIINVKYLDYQHHVFEPLELQGALATQTTVVLPQAGYGTWEQMGTQSVTLAGGSANGTPFTMYYFKRTA